MSDRLARVAAVAREEPEVVGGRCGWQQLRAAREPLFGPLRVAHAVLSDAGPEPGTEVAGIELHRSFVVRHGLPRLLLVEGEISEKLMEAGLAGQQFHGLVREAPGAGNVLFLSRRKRLVVLLVRGLHLQQWCDPCGVALGAKVAASAKL